jgi:hypothetical protein
MVKGSLRETHTDSRCMKCGLPIKETRLLNWKRAAVPRWVFVTLLVAMDGIPIAKP